MKIRTRGVSYVSYRTCVKYGEWDGGLCTIEGGKSTRIEGEVPSLAETTVAGERYVGNIEGEVWKINSHEKVLVFKGKGNIEYTKYNTSSVIGMHGYGPFVVIVLICGEVHLHDTRDRKTERAFQIEKTITESAIKGKKLLYVVDGRQIEIYDLENKTTKKLRSLAEGEKITKAAFLQDDKRSAVAYGTEEGRVCVDYPDKILGTAGYTFKAHKKDVGSDEVFYPVTMVCGVSETEIVTGGADGKVYLWDVKSRSRIRKLCTSKNPIIHGDANVEKGRVEALALVVGDCLDAMYSCSAEDQMEVHIVNVDKK